MKRFDKRYIYYCMVTAVASALVFMLVFLQDVIFDAALWASGRWLGTVLAAYGVVYGIQVLWAVLLVRTSGYELTDSEIRCRRGVIARKTSVLAYPKIHAVNKKQNIIHQIFGIAVLTVDSGATANAFGAEITIVERSGEVDRLMATIRSRQEGRTEEEAAPEAVPEELYSFSSKLKFVYSALTVGASVLALLVLVAVAVTGLIVASAMLQDGPDFSASQVWIWALIIAGIALAVMTAISMIGGILISYVGYHDFQVHKTPSHIQISYGMFVRHTNNFRSRRIRALKIMEGPVKRMFGFCAAGLEVVGYGTSSSSDESGKDQTAAPGILLPLCRKKDLNAVLEGIIPGYVPDPIDHRAKSYWAFVLWPVFWLSVIFGAAAVIVMTVMLLFGAQTMTVLAIMGVIGGVWGILLMGLLISGALQYLNAGLGIGDGKVTVRNGALVRRQTVIRRKDIIAIQRVTTPMRRKKGICSYQIHFFSNAMTNTVMVKNLDAELADALEALLRA